MPLEALNFGALNVVFNTWVFLGFLLTKSGLNSKSHVATLASLVKPGTDSTE